MMVEHVSHPSATFDNSSNWQTSRQVGMDRLFRPLDKLPKH